MNGVSLTKSKILCGAKSKSYNTMRLIFLFGLLQLAASSAFPPRQITVMSYNIHHGANKDEVNTLDSMGAFIKRSGADLIGLQEVDSMCIRSGKVDQMKHLAAITGMHYAFVRHFAFDGGAYGQGILSRYPIQQVANNRLTILKKDSLRQSLALITAVVKLPGKGSVLFANAHFSLDQPTRLIQAMEVTQLLEKNGLPAIFTGDLNATPYAEEIIWLNQNLVNTAPRPLPSFPVEQPAKTIDYIYFNKALKGKTGTHWVPAIPHSDHLPVLSSIRY